jgi:nucleoside-diphosphate-sugar epimerase
VRIAVTGASGDVGGFVARELAGAGHEVVGVDLREREGLPLARFARADVGSRAELEGAFAGCAAVVHLAAIRDPGIVPDATLFQVNVVGTFNALEAAVAQGVPRFVLASSEAVLGMAADHAVPDYLPMDEEHPLRPCDAYALSKVLGEELCRSYANRGALSTVCLRTAFVYSLAWREDALGSLAFEDRGRRGVWSYVDARDAARAYRLACEARDVRHEALFVVASDIRSPAPTADVLGRHFPDVPLRAPIDEFGPVISGARAKAVLGFEPRHSWREDVSIAEIEAAAASA